MPLTDTAVKQAKPASKPVKLSDGKGMYLLVNPNGSKLWRWKYRVLGKEKVMALGAYPEISVAQARNGLLEARKLLAAGADPMAVRKADKVASLAASENSFQSVAVVWWEHWRGPKSPRHADDVLRRLPAQKSRARISRLPARRCGSGPRTAGMRASRSPCVPAPRSHCSTSMP